MLKLVVDNTKPHIGDLVQVCFDGSTVQNGVVVGRRSADNAPYRVYFTNGATLSCRSGDIVNNITRQNIAHNL